MNTQRSRGFVLVFAILLLLVMTLIGISIMSGSQMQERMSGNARLQSLAFQAATAGVADAVSFVKDVNVLAPGLICGGSNLAEWEAVWLDKTVSPHRPRPTDWFPRAGNGEPNVEIFSRLYCLWDAGEDQGRSHLYVESQGIVRTAGQVVANRSVEVRVVSGRDSTLGDPTCAIQALCVGQDNPLSEFNPPASNASFVGGDTGHAICACNDAMRKTVVDKIASNRQGSFTGAGGIGAAAIQGADDDGNYATRSPFDDLDSFQQFINELELIAKNNDPPTVSAGGHSGNFDWPNQVRFVDGDLYARGGNSGSGILVVTGDIDLGGNFLWEGLVIGMGEILSLKGSGGQKHGVRGSVVAAPMDRATGTLGQVNLSFHEPGSTGGAGGGGVSYAFDCDALKGAEKLLTATAGNLWQANCDGGIENIFVSGPAELQLVSWRENLGWREQESFFSTKLVPLNN